MPVGCPWVTAPAAMCHFALVQTTIPARRHTLAAMESVHARNHSGAARTLLPYRYEYAPTLISPRTPLLPFTYYPRLNLANPASRMHGCAPLPTTASLLFRFRAYLGGDGNLQAPNGSRRMAAIVVRTLPRPPLYTRRIPQPPTYHHHVCEIVLKL